MSPNPNNPNSTRPAQILVSERDRGLARDIAERLAVCGQRVPGPTGLYRAGLVALTALADTELIAMFDAAEDRLTAPQIEQLYAQWCARVAAIVKQEPTLEYAWADEQQSGPGHFANVSRFASLSLMEDGRVLISGFAAHSATAAENNRVPHMSVLFPFGPSGLATTLSLNDEGCAIAARAIIAWLTNREDDITAVRAEIAAHQSHALR
ncbi:MAG: hypothetical protein NVSMB31_00420 [Vulcanimicrobiaceae bacterium]